MGPATLTRSGGTNARHRADVPRLARLRRDVAHLLAGSDLYAADRELRPEAHAAAGSSPQTADRATPAAIPSPVAVTA